MTGLDELRGVPLPNPGYVSGGREFCNAPLSTPDGTVVAHCQILVKSETRRRPRVEHRERHRVEWR